MNNIQFYLYNLATDRYKGLVASVIKSFLFILSLIYRAVAGALIKLHRSQPYPLDCRVISVGNITLGGTGKTSLVEYIARYLSQKGHKVVILSRGYKRKYKRYALHVARYDRMGDEPFMLQNNLKNLNIDVLVDPDRIRSAKRAIRDYGADTVILDDGFQQWKIKKDLEIVTIDATNPFGNQHLLPRGILREPLSSLARADIFVLTKVNLNPDTRQLKDILAQINPAALVVESEHQPTGLYELNQPQMPLNIGELKNKTVTLISGIGDPGSFENLIVCLGATIGLSFRFPDHHAYTQKDLKMVIKESQKKNIDTIVTTEKDAARLQSLQLKAYLPAGQAGSLKLLVLRIALTIIKNEEGFHSRLLKLYNP